MSKTLVSAAERLGHLLHHRKADLDYGDAWWEKMRGFLEQTFTDLELASAGTLLAPPMRSADGRGIYVKSFFHRSNPQNDTFDKFIRLSKGTYMDSRIHLHSTLPEDAPKLLNSWRCGVS